MTYEEKMQCLREGRNVSPETMKELIELHNFVHKFFATEESGFPIGVITLTVAYEYGRLEGQKEKTAD